MQQYMLHPFFVCYRCSVNLLQEVFFVVKTYYKACRIVLFLIPLQYE